MNIKVSVVIIAKNAQSTLADTLQSLAPFAEVILYLNDSTDESKSVGEKFNNVTVIEGTFEGFGPTKNRAASYATNEWVLSLDSDEIIPIALQEEISALTLQDPNTLYLLKRDNYFLGRHIKHSGWGNDRLIRLYNRNVHQFHDKMVHESIAQTDISLVVELQSSFQHNAVQDINQFLQKVMKYSDLAAKDKKTCFFLVVLLKANFAFFKTYLLQLGFMDGWRGFVIAISNFNGKFFRYTKRYINCKKK